MTIESYLTFARQTGPPGLHPTPEKPGIDDALETLLHGKSRILARKLEILAAELNWRICTAAQNVLSLHQDEQAVRESLRNLDIDVNYRLRDHSEKAPFYRRLFDIESARRSERVELWRDVANLLRDMLGAWEAHEQAKARSIFLHDVEPGTPGYVQET